MIPEDVLERGLAAAAEAYEVPPDAVDKLREEIAPLQDDQRRFRPRVSRRGTVLLMAAAVVVLLIVLPFALGGGGGGSPSIRQTALQPPAAAPIASPAGGGTFLSSGGGAGATAGSKALHGPSAGAPANAGQRQSTGAGATTTAGGTAVGGAESVPRIPTRTDELAQPQPPIPSVQSRVIKTGELDLQVQKGKVGPTLDGLTGIATVEGGYIANSRTSEGGDEPSGEVTIRVPVAKFEDAIQRARHLAQVKVLSLDTSGQDVTSRYVDTQARIHALQATRATFLTLMSKATTIGETLVVQQHVNDVQTQIEQLQGQLKVLGDRSAFSTLTVTVDQKVAQVAVAKPHHKSGLHKAFDRSVSRFARGFDAIVGAIGPLLLALLIVAAFTFVGVFGYRRFRRRLV